MTTPITYRDGTHADYKGIANVQFTNHIVVYSTFITNSAWNPQRDYYEQRYDFLLTYLETHPGQCRVAVAANMIAGYMITMPLDETWGFVKRGAAFIEDFRQGENLAWVLRYLHIHPDYHKRGIGKHLMYEAFDYARQASAQKIILDASINNINALQFYEKHGWQFVTEAAYDPTDNKDLATILEYIL